jgi:GNAT superfamily N-acetyltransferase
MTELRARSATAADYTTFARLFPELAVPDPLPTPEAFVERMVNRVLIVEDDSGPLGYGFYMFYGSTMHVVHVVAAKEARGRGVGGAIMKELRARALAEGCARWMLNVKQDNAPAIRVYERAGMTRELEGWTLDMPWSALASWPDGDGSVVPHAPEPAEDQALATRLTLDVARLDALRQRPGVVLLAMKRNGLHDAFAAFDPSFPGVYPIRVLDPSLAKPLVQAFRPYAKHDHTHVWVEANAELRDQLLGAGATQKFSIYRMSAPLP